MSTRVMKGITLWLTSCGASPETPLTNVRGSVDSATYRAATAKERFCHRLLTSSAAPAPKSRQPIKAAKKKE